MLEFFAFVILVFILILLWLKYVRPAIEEENTYRNLLIEKTSLEIDKLNYELMQIYEEDVERSNYYER